MDDYIAKMAGPYDNRTRDLYIIYCSLHYTGSYNRIFIVGFLWRIIQQDIYCRFPLADHTTGTDLGFFIQLSKDNLQKAGDRYLFI